MFLVELVNFHTLFIITNLFAISYLFSTFTDTSRKPIKISFADGGLLWYTIRYHTIYAVPHKSVLNSYVISNLFTISNHNKIIDNYTGKALENSKNSSVDTKSNTYSLVSSITASPSTSLATFPVTVPGILFRILILSPFWASSSHFVST